MSELEDKDSEKIDHPGYAIKFADGDYLGTAHGWCGGPVYFATIFETKERADQVLVEEEWINGEVVVAYEPLIAKLQKEIKDLKKANNFSPDKLRNIRFRLDEIKTNLEDVILEIKK